MKAKPATADGPPIPKARLKSEIEFGSQETRKETGIEAVTDRDAHGRPFKAGENAVRRL
jgi:hypothetical protein